MTPEIGNNFILYSTAADIWKAAKELYSQTDNVAEIYELETQVSEIKQGDQSVSAYYSQLTLIWQQIDTYETHNWGLPADALAFKKFIETKRVFRFLQGLHKDFDSVRSRVLSTKPFPSLNSAFSEVRLEESRIKVMMGGQTNSTENSGSALAVQKYAPETSTALSTYKGSAQGGKFQGARPYCKFCNRHGHTYDNCYSRPDAKVQRPSKFFGNNWKNNQNWRGGNNSNWKPPTNDNWKGNKAQGSMAHMVNQVNSELYSQQNDQFGQGNHPLFNNSLILYLNCLDNNRLRKLLQILRELHQLYLLQQWLKQVTLVILLM